jgi:ADP-ribosylglycohydrolase
MQPNQSLPLDRALCSLEGLSVGDAFGERFFVHPTIVEGLLAKRILPIPPWRFTDDTEMALSIVEILQDYGVIKQDELAWRFAERYDSSRGYGAGMHGTLARVRAGESWRIVAPSRFGGQGSSGNGAAMRAAPIGGYFADDLAAVVEQAHRSAEVTHAHPEGIAGAIAIAVAAAWAWQLRDTRVTIAPYDYLDCLLPYIPESTVRAKIVRARDVRPEIEVEHVAAMLGSGNQISAQDTVPFALWCAAHHLDNYEEALWVTVRGLGDRDTTCAMVGGIVSLATGLEGIPRDWRANREPLGWPR